MIPYGRQCISRQDIDAVVEVLNSDWLTQGPMVPSFESTVANKVGAAQAVAVSSATSALHIACLALGLGPGDRLWTSTNTFVASANCARYCGADVDFVDIDPRTYNLSVEALTAKLEQADRIGALPKIVVPVHFAGQSCEMAAIHALGHRYGFKVIEDASHAIGGEYLGSAVGKCVYSDITIFSFHPVKVVTTGEGGMALTNDAALAERMRLLRSHGVTRRIEEIEKVSEGSWYYEQIELGFNYRMTDIQAALGMSQFGRIDEFIARRRQIAEQYDKTLLDLPLLLPFQNPDAKSAFHLYVVQVNTATSPVGRRVLFDRLRTLGIGVNVHYIPVHTQPYYKALGFWPGQYPEAERYYANALSLPIYFDLQKAQQAEIAATLAQVLRP